MIKAEIVVCSPPCSQFHLISQNSNIYRTYVLYKSAPIFTIGPICQLSKPSVDGRHDVEQSYSTLEKDKIEGAPQRELLFVRCLLNRV